MTAVFVFLAVLSLLGYRMIAVPAVWAECIRLHVQRGATPEQARLILGWKRMQLLAHAVACAVAGAAL